MLLTLKPSPQNGIKGPSHEYSVLRHSIPTPRSLSPPVPDLSSSAVPLTPAADYSMDSSRNGLPRPSSLTLPPPDVGFVTMAAPLNQQLPPPPAQWQSPDDAMHQWLQAKAEEDRRKQEEEKTRQETLRLEQRRVEQSMLRDSLQAGVPPHMVPLIFAGISQGGLPQPILELTQQYLSQSPGARGSTPQLPSLAHPHSHSHSHSNSHSHSHSHPNPQQRPPHTRRESRSIPPPSPYAPHPTQQAVPPPNILLSQNLPSNLGAPPTPQTVGRPSISGGPAEPRPGTTPQMNPGGGSQVQSAPINLSNVQYAPGSSVPHPQASGKPDAQSRQSQPSLYFHHWVPPGQSHSATPAGKTRQDSPVSSSVTRRPEYQTSPGRKRKAPGPHQPAPLPSRPSENLSGFPPNSQPSSPTTGDRLGESPAYRHRPSDTTISYEHRSSENVELERTEKKLDMTQVAPDTVSLPPNRPNLEKSRQPTDDSEPSGDPALVEGTGKYPSRVLQAQYASSIKIGSRDSDVDSSPQVSPTSTTPLGLNQYRDTPGA